MDSGMEAWRTCRRPGWVPLEPMGGRKGTAGPQSCQRSDPTSMLAGVARRSTLCDGSTSGAILKTPAGTTASPPQPPTAARIAAELIRANAVSLPAVAPNATMSHGADDGGDDDDDVGVESVSAAARTVARIVVAVHIGKLVSQLKKPSTPLDGIMARAVLVLALLAAACMAPARPHHPKLRPVRTLITFSPVP